MDFHILSTNLSIRDQFQDSEYVIKIFIQLNLRVPLPIEISTPITGVNLQVDLLALLLLVTLKDHCNSEEIEPAQSNSHAQNYTKTNTTLRNFRKDSSGQSGPYPAKIDTVPISKSKLPTIS